MRGSENKINKLLVVPQKSPKILANPADQLTVEPIWPTSVGILHRALFLPPGVLHQFGREVRVLGDPA